MISLILPTRNRPNNLKRLYQSLVDTTDDLKNVELCFYIDEDDMQSLPVITELAEKIQCQCIQGEAAPKVRVPVWYLQNEVQKISTGPIYMFAADDIVFRTKNWDNMVNQQFEKFEDRIALVYGPDGFQKGDIPVCTHGFIHQHWIDVVGYLFPSDFNVCYVDRWVTEVAEMIGRRFYLPDMYIEHIHPAAGKAAWDNTYTSKQESVGGEANLYAQTLSERIASAEKLKKYISIFDV
jgi:hypothetical protein